MKGGGTISEREREGGIMRGRERRRDNMRRENDKRRYNELERERWREMRGK